MPKRVLDTSVLVTYWRRRRSEIPGQPSVADAERWARDLAAIHSQAAIVTPIRCEFLAGTKDSAEQQAAEAFLDQFQNLDDGNIPRQDWDETPRIAKRIPHDRKPRQLGDCLIRAIAKRLKYDVFTLDKGFPKS
jgi:predicted nucleic acid-binding protein